MAGKGSSKEVMRQIGEKTRLKKNDPRTRQIVTKAHAVQSAQAALRSSEKLVECDKNGTFAELIDNMLRSLKKMYTKEKYADYFKNAAWLLEMVNGKQINIKAEGNVKRDINIVFRRATPQDAK